jgi:hypothetical protein
MFCSEVVAFVLKSLNKIDQEREPDSYDPNDFDEIEGINGTSWSDTKKIK